MPTDTKTHMIISAIVTREKGEAFKQLAKKHYRSMSAELVQLIDKALKEDQTKP